MVDQCAVAMGKVEDGIQHLGLGERASIRRSSFIDFPWKHYLKFDLVFLCHTTGYMDDAQLAHFLTEAGKNLSALEINDFSSATVG